MRKLKLRLEFAMAIIFFSGIFCFAAEDPGRYPLKPVTMIIQFAPGGVTDAVTRKLSETASKLLGQPILIESKPGGAGVLATSAIAKAAPDGYTLGTISYSATTIIPHLRQVPYNTKADFIYLLQFAEYGDSFFCVRSDSPWKTFKQFIEDARKNPGKLNYATPGALSAHHAVMEHIFSSVEKVKINHVPIAGTVELATSLLGGHVHAGQGSGLRPHVEAGKLKILALFGQKRMKEFPEVPTFSELGYDVNLPTWLGLCAPKGIDPRIHKKIRDAFKAAFDEPSYHETCTNVGMIPVFKDSESFREMVMREFDIWAKMLKEIGFVK